jgi:LacI family transcriptional regulator
MTIDEDHRRATIKEVAQRAGVSSSTASRALTGTGYVATAVRERVRDAARELGYVVDAGARSLKQQSSRLIGVLVSDLRDFFYADLAAGAGGESRAHGYTMVLITDGRDAAEQLVAAEQFVALRVAGVVATPVGAEVVRFLQRHRIPVVELDRQFAPDDADAVVIDNRGSARAATVALLELGHRRIALLIDETDWTTGRERLAGYREALADAGLQSASELIVPTGWDVEATRRTARELLSGPDRPTAIFAANNLIAEGVWRTAADLGLVVPRDLSVVAFDDAPWMSMVRPGLTAITQDAPRMGAAAVELLIGRLADPGAAPRLVTVPATLTSRGSTAPPR